MNDLKDAMSDLFKGELTEETKNMLLKIAAFSGIAMLSYRIFDGSRRYGTYRIAELLSVANEMLFLSVTLKTSELKGEEITTYPEFDEQTREEFIEKCGLMSKLTDVLPEGYYAEHPLITTDTDELCVMMDTNLKLLNFLYTAVMVENRSTDSVEAVMQALRVVRNNLSLPIVNEETREHYVKAYEDLSKLLIEFRHELKGYCNVIRTGTAESKDAGRSYFSSITSFFTGVFK